MDEVLGVATIQFVLGKHVLILLYELHQLTLPEGRYFTRVDIDFIQSETVKFVLEGRSYRGATGMICALMRALVLCPQLRVMGVVHVELKIF